MSIFLLMVAMAVGAVLYIFFNLAFLFGVCFAALLCLCIFGDQMLFKIKPPPSERRKKSMLKRLK